MLLEYVFFHIFLLSMTYANDMGYPNERLDTGGLQSPTGDGSRAVVISNDIATSDNMTPWYQTCSASNSFISVNYSLSFRATFICAAFRVDNKAPTSPLSIKFASIVSSVSIMGPSRYEASLIIDTGLEPSTYYDVYCLFEQYGTFARPSMSQIMAKKCSSIKLSATTTKSVLLSSSSSWLVPGTTSGDFQVSLPSPPLHTLVVTPQIVFLGPKLCDIYTRHTGYKVYNDYSVAQSAPLSLSFLPIGSPLNQAFYVNLPRAGCYNITALLSGPEDVHRTVIVTYPLSPSISQTKAQTPPSSFFLLDSIPLPEISFLRIVSLQFVGPRGMLQMRFSFVTYLGSTVDFQNPFPCDVLLVFPAATYSKCNFISRSVLSIQLPSSRKGIDRLADGHLQLLSPGSLVELKGGVLQPACNIPSTHSCRDMPFMEKQSATVSLVNPYVPPPVAVISSVHTAYFDPTNKQAYGLMLDITGSSGDVGRPWGSMEWTVFDTEGTKCVSVSDYLNSDKLRWVHCAPGAYDCDTLPTSLFVKPGTYTIVLNITNFLGCSSVGSTLVTIKLLTSNSSSHIYNETAKPQVRLLGRRTLAVSANVTTTIESYLVDPTSDSYVSFSWEIRPVNQVTTEPLQFLGNRDRRKLFIPSYFLSSDAEYAVCVSLWHQGEIVSQDEIHLYVYPSQLVAVLYGSSDRTMSSRDTKQLDASPSYITTASTPLNDSSAFFLWQCVQISPMISLSPQNPCAQLGANTSYPHEDFSQSRIVDITKTFQVEIQTQFVYTVTVWIPTLPNVIASSATVTITVMPSTKPAPKTEYAAVAKYISASDYIYLTAWISYASPYVATWSGAGLNSTLLSQITFPAGEQFFPLYLPASRLPSTASYKFQLTVTPLHCNACPTTSKRITISVNYPPDSGYSFSIPSSGIEDTVFALITTGWLDSDLPLSFSFLQSTGQNDSSTFLIRQRSFLSYANSILTPHRHNIGESDLVNIIVVVHDNLMCEASSSFEVGVTPNSPFNAPNWVKTIESRVSSAIVSKNSDALFSLMNAVQALIFEDAHICHLFPSGPCYAVFATGLAGLKELYHLIDEDGIIIQSIASSMERLTSQRDVYKDASMNVLDDCLTIFRQLAASKSLASVRPKSIDLVLRALTNTASNIIDILLLKNATQLRTLPQSFLLKLSHEDDRDSTYKEKVHNRNEGNRGRLSHGGLVRSVAVPEKHPIESKERDSAFDAVESSLSLAALNLLSIMKLNEEVRTPRTAYFEVLIRKAWISNYKEDFVVNESSSTAWTNSSTGQRTLLTSTLLSSSVSNLGYFQLSSRPFYSDCISGGWSEGCSYLSDRLSVKIHATSTIVPPDSSIFFELTPTTNSSQYIIPSNTSRPVTGSVHCSSMEPVTYTCPEVFNGFAYVFTETCPFVRSNSSFKPEITMKFTCPVYKVSQFCNDAHDALDSCKSVSATQISSKFKSQSMFNGSSQSDFFCACQMMMSAVEDNDKGIFDLPVSAAAISDISSLEYSWRGTVWKGASLYYDKSPEVEISIRNLFRNASSTQSRSTGLSGEAIQWIAGIILIILFSTFIIFAVSRAWLKKRRDDMSLHEALTTLMDEEIARMRTKAAAALAMVMPIENADHSSIAAIENISMASECTADVKNGDRAGALNSDTGHGERGVKESSARPVYIMTEVSSDTI